MIVPKYSRWKELHDKDEVQVFTLACSRNIPEKRDRNNESIDFFVISISSNVENFKKDFFPTVQKRKKTFN